MDKYAGLASLFDPSVGSGVPALDELIGIRPYTAKEREEDKRRELADIEAYTGGEATPTQGGGEQNLAFARKYLAAKGLPAHIAAGAVGNFAQESSGISGGSLNKEGGLGIAQWRKERLYGGGGYEGLIPFAKRQGRSPQDLTTQLDYFVSELQGPERAALEKAMQTRTPEQAAVILGRYYERPNEQYANYENRAAQARRFAAIPDEQIQNAPSGMYLDVTGGRPFQQRQGQSPQYSQLETTPMQLSTGQTINVEKGMTHAEVAAMLKKEGIEGVPLRQFQAPNGQTVNAEYDMSDDEVLGMLRKEAPEYATPQGAPTPNKSSYGAAAKESLLTSGAGIFTGLGGETKELGKAVADTELLGQYAKPIGEAITGAGESMRGYGEELGHRAEGVFEMPKDASWFEKTVGYPIVQTGAGVVPYAAAYAIPGVGPVTGTAALYGGAMGGLEERAKETGKEFVPSEARPYAVGETALDYVGGRLLGPLKKLFSDDVVLGARETIIKAVEKGGIEEAKKLVGSRLGNIAKQVGITDAAFTSSEVAENVIERAYAGQPLFDDSALQEYVGTAKQVAGFGGVAGVVQGLGRHHIKATEVARIEEQKATEEALAAQEKAQLAQQTALEEQAVAKAEKRKERQPIEIPEELQGMPYKDAVRYMQMQEAKAQPVAEEAPAEAPVEEVPEPTVQEKPYYEQLGLKARKNTLVMKGLKQLNPDDPSHGPTINAFLDEIEAKNMPRDQQAIDALRTKLNEVQQNAQQVSETGPTDGGGSAQPSVLEESGDQTISGEGMEPSRQGEQDVEVDDEEPTEKVRAVAGEVPKKARVAYHAGDLGYGKDTTLGRMSGSRSTGHFGTGVYFTGDKAKLASRANRQIHEVDLSKYNLLRLRTEEDAQQVHDAMQGINSLVSRVKDGKLPLTKEGKPDFKTDEAFKLRKAAFALWVEAKPKKDGKRLSAEDIEELIKKHVEERAGVYDRVANLPGYEDTAATRVIKDFGYEGIDVSGVPKFDSGDYGSVIYSKSLAPEEVSAKSAKSAAEIFEPTSIEQHKTPGDMSKDKLVEMPIADFLKLAKEEEPVDYKGEALNKSLDAGEKLRNIPQLWFAYKNGQQTVVGHEGRHRARALMERGYTHMPVLMRSGDIRWSEQASPSRFDYIAEWPTTLKGENGDIVDFPITREDAESEYAPVRQEPTEKVRAVAGEIPASKIKVNGKERPTTDSAGWRIHPTDEGVKKFWETPTLTDDSGRPIRLYHGTKGDISKFDESPFGNLGAGVYLAADPGEASDFALGVKADKKEPDIANANVLPVYVKSDNILKNDAVPLDWQQYIATHYLKDPNAKDADSAMFWYYMDEEKKRSLVSLYNKLVKGEATLADIFYPYKGGALPDWNGLLSNHFRNAGWEGLEVKRPSWKGAEYVIFSPSKIKSAIGNTGEFDTTKAEIRAAQAKNLDEGLMPLPIPEFESATDAKDLLNRYIKVATDAHLHGLAKTYLASPYLKAVKVTFFKQGDKIPRNVKNAFDVGKAGAVTAVGKDGAHLYFKADDPDVFREDNLLHEVTHALTEASLARNSSARVELTGLSDKISRVLHSNNPNAGKFWDDIIGKEPSEVLAYSLTLPSFRQILSKYDEDGHRLKAKPAAFKGQAPVRTLWQKFVDTLTRLFGLPSKQKQAYDTALNEYLDRKAEYEKQVADYNAQRPMQAKLDSILQELLKTTAAEGVAMPSDTAVKSVKEAPRAERGLAGKLKDKDFGEKLSEATRDVLTSGRQTSLRSEWLDQSEALGKVTEDLPTMVGKKARVDFLASHVAQVGNVIADSIHNGFVEDVGDGSVMTIKDHSLAPEKIFRRVAETGKKELFNEMLVALRGRSIREADIKTKALADDLLTKADELDDYASTLQDKKKRASFTRSAQNLRTLAEKKLEGINYEKGRTEVTEADIRKAEALERAEPELAREAQNIYDLLRKSVDLLEDSGLIDAKTAKQYREYPNYIPLYKVQDFEEAMIDPKKHLQLIISKMGRGANKLPEIKRQKAHFHEVMVESNILKHIALCTMTAAKNNLNKAAALQMELVGAAEPSRLGKDDPDAVQFRDKGEVKYYTIKDKQALFALQAAQPLINPIFKQLKKVSGVVRGAMVMNPLFWYRQLVREPLTASLVGRTGLVTPFDTLAEITKIAAGKSKRYEDLKRRGIVAAQDVITDPIEFIKYVEKGKGWTTKGIERIKEIHEAVDGATRAVVAERAYQDAISKGLSEEDANNLAAIKAREIINFSKQGRSQNVRVMRATTPFFGAALNGLDVLMKAAMPRKYGRLSKAEAMEARRMFYSRASMIALYTTAYAMANSDDEDYLSTVDRAGNWLVPTGNKDNPFAKISIPYELGFFIKTLPELITLMNMGAISTKKAVTEAGKAAWETVVPPMPTIYAIKPAVEAFINFDFHTQSPIETGSDSRGMIHLKNKKAGELTKAIASNLHDAGIDLETLSPDRIEHVLSGYFGQIWAMARAASDYALYDGPEKPEKILSDYPLIGGAVTKGARDAAVNDFYMVYGNVRDLAESVSKAGTGGDVDILEKLREDKNYAKYMRANTPLGDKMQAMDNKMQVIARIEKDPTIDAAEKKRRIDIQNEQRNTLAKQGLDIARKLGLEF